jgi:four helix bundle protein
MMGRFDDLILYKKAFALSVKIHRQTRQFPREEIVGITSQIRRSSAAVCAIFAECYGRRTHRKYFLLKLQEMAGENAETQVWLDMAQTLGMLSHGDYNALTEENQEVGRLIRFMITHPEKFS